MTLLAAAVFASTDCEQILDIPDRKTRPNVACESGDCACSPGFGDCDDSLANGCEIDLSTDQSNCGACGASCENGTCVAAQCTCNTGYSDCDGNAADGCESELASSPSNCGACGHDCLGGGCEENLCTPAVLASGNSLSDVLLAGGNLYYIDWDGIGAAKVLEVPAAGGQPVVLASVNDGLDTLAVTGSTVFAGSRTELYRIDGATHTATPVYAPAPNEIEDVAAAGDTVYVLTFPDTSSPGEIVAIDAVSLVTTSVSTDVDAGNFTLPIARGEPVWIDTSLGVSTVVAGVVTPIADAPSNPADLAADGDFVFDAQYVTSFEVVRIDLSTGETVTTTAVPATYRHFAARGPTLAWYDDGGSLAEWDGTNVRTIAQNLHLEYRIALDDEAMYATSLEGDLLRVAR